MPKKKVSTITGPGDAVYPIDIIDKQIVKRDQMVRRVIAEAEKVSNYVKQAKARIDYLVLEHLNELSKANGVDEYEGSTVLRSFDNTLTIEIDVKKQFTYDERLNTAGTIIKTWIDGKLALVTDPKLRKMFEQISNIAKSALRIDAKGKVDKSKLLQLKKFEFAEEPEWNKAMELITASEQETGTKRYLRFKKADDKGKLEGIPVNFFEF